MSENPLPESTESAPIDSDDRKRRLARQIQSEVTQGGRVESQNDFDAVIATGGDINHTLHLIITIVTCGIWGLVWIVLALQGGVKRKLVSIDEYGNTLVQKIQTK